MMNERNRYMVVYRMRLVWIDMLSHECLLSYMMDEVS